MATPSPRRSRSDTDFESWLARLTDRIDPFMAWLGAVFALLVGFQLTVKVRPPVRLALDITTWAIWAAFVAEYLIKFWLAPAKREFLRRHWLQAFGLILPALRVLSFFRLAWLGRALPATRVLASSQRGAHTARRILRSRLGYLSALAVIVIIGSAELAYLFERRWTLRTFPDALVWAGMVVIGMQADPVPATRPGQVVMLFGFASGLVLIATLAGSLAAFLFEGIREQEAEEEREER
ncbi:MAG TPA: ion transporter [Micromonospora sp.]|nr:ion transporter [Micromonospora sp.]